MTAGTFTDVVGGRDFTVGDVSRYPTPSSVACPNSDPASAFIAVSAGLSHEGAEYADPSGAFLPPWGTDDWSLELWAYIPSGTYISSHQELVHRPGNLWNVVWNGSTTWELTLRDDSSSVIAARDLPVTPDSTWHHLLWTLNSSLGNGAVSGREVKGYLDGTLYGTTSIAASAFTQTPTGTIPTSRLYFGFNTQAITTAKIAIYHRLLDAADAADHYTLMTT